MELDAIKHEVTKGINSNDTEEGREEPTIVNASNKSKNDRLYKEPYSKSKNVVDTEPTLKYDQVTSPTPKCSVYKELNKIFIPVVLKPYQLL